MRQHKLLKRLFTAYPIIPYAISLVVALIIGSIIIYIITPTSISADDDTIPAIPMLSRQEQIELMKECLEDANIIMRSGSYAGIIQSNLAAAFFEYRAR